MPTCPPGCCAMNWASASMSLPTEPPADAGPLATGPTRPLSRARKGEAGVVARVVHRGPADAIADRLEALGFVPGEPLRVVATGPLGGEPIVVRIGSTRFALRLLEAERVLLADGEGAAR